MPDRALFLGAAAGTLVAAADLVRVGLSGSGRWPWPLVWLPIAAWATWVHRRPDRRSRAPVTAAGPTSGLLAGAALALAAVVATAVGLGLGRANPLVAHDEAVYSGLARSWTGPLPAAGFQVYRPVGISVLGAGVLRLFGTGTGPDGQLLLLRGLAVLLAVVALGVMFLLGRAVTTPARAATAVLVVLASATFERRTYEFMNDIPAAAMLCLTALFLLQAMRSGRLRPLLLAVLAGLVAFYLRYGALSGVLALGAATVLADGPRAWWARRRQLAVAIGAGLAGMLPFAVYSMRRTGSPWGVLSRAQEVAHNAYPGAGLVHYLMWAPIRLLGNLGGPVLLAAALALVLALRRPPGDDRRRRYVLLAGAALLQSVALGLTAHAEERFVYFPLMAAALVGVDAIARAAGRYGRPAVAFVAVFAVLQMPASFWFEWHHVGALQAEDVAMGAAAHRLVAPPCLALGPRWGPAPDPEVGWYSGCDVRTVSSSRLPASCRVGFAVLVGTGADRDPRVERASSVLLARRRAACGATATATSGPASFSGPEGHGVRLFVG